MNAMDVTHVDTAEPRGALSSALPSAGSPSTGMPSAEAVATSRVPQHWGRAMAVAIGKLADQLAAEDGHEALMGRELRLRITEDPGGVRIAMWCLPEE
ncbi:hypothetical protein [Arthrobacter sp. AZCC_0090]|uniref:hypothetical protein n=1 Tax=Arthrobacter sp. AZCC_0090 TaxID=2735881 RepID=UPI00161EEC23|nr:hypothetical protein [Arthrobacter sp. AZCC_0090]MBB6405542.1 hypothetical protein [Arthrobacter sp. AZCC_0090]